MSRYTGNFNVVDIFTCNCEIYNKWVPANPGVNEHPVIRCEYNENNIPFHTAYKNVHIDLFQFGDWIKFNRQNILDELFK